VNKRKRKKRSHVIRNFVCGTAALPVSYCRVVRAGAEGMLGSKLVVQARPLWLFGNSAEGVEDG
jgi:hypothetical protein